jgi:hypothetical protein
MNNQFKTDKELKNGKEFTYLRGCCNCVNGIFPMPDVCKDCRDLSKWEYMHTKEVKDSD